MKAIVRERIPEVAFQVNGNGTAAVKPAVGKFRVRAAFYILFAAAIGFVAAGSYTVVRGWDARGEVHDQLVAQRITTPEDASIRNAPVDDAATAKAQADVIQKHALEATGGKTYAQMDREDPARQTAFTASALRTSLMAAVLAWETANLAMGFGAFVAGIGLLLVVTLLLLRPKFKAT
jgi:hypothetical protein